jgi:hypothetical protein
MMKKTLVAPAKPADMARALLVPGRLGNGGYLKGSGRGVLSEDGGRMGNWKLG